MFSFRLKQVPIVRSRAAVSVSHREAGEQAEALELVWSFLLKNEDRFVDDLLSEGDAIAIVSHLRQEEIARRIGVPLHRVIEAIERLSTEERISVRRQDAGQPNQYLIRKRDKTSLRKIAL